MASTTRSHFQQSVTPAALRAYLAEFISTFLFVFVAVGSAMSASTRSTSIIPHASLLFSCPHGNATLTTILLNFPAVTGKATPDSGAWDASSLVATALAQALALFAAIYIAANSSGSHVNPAVTFGLAVAGHVTIPTAVFYWASQLAGSTLACLLLRVATAGQVP